MAEATREVKMAADNSKSLVQESWALVAQDLDTHGIKFFLRIFEIAPPALQLFSFKDDADLASSPAMKKHAASVMNTVGAAVAGLSDVASLIPVLQALGKRHANYGVESAHFAAVQGRRYDV